MQATAYAHIVIDQAGHARVVGTTLKVIELVLEQQAYGWSPAELQFQHPYLEPGQIHSALAYYWDHRATLDAVIQEQLAAAEVSRHRGFVPTAAQSGASVPTA